MAEYVAIQEQLVNPGESVIFTQSPVPCNRGLVRHRDDTGSFMLSGWVPNTYTCPCRRANSANYLIDFGANIAIPEGQTVGPIQVSLAIEGATVAVSTMIVNPAAVQEYQNVSRAINVPIWRGCCESVSIRNTSTIPILVQNANLLITRPDLNVTM